MKTRHFWQQAAIATLVLVASWTVHAVNSSARDPLTLLQHVSADMSQTLDQNRGRIKKDTGFLEDVIRQKVAPHFTVSTMARSVVGRHAWNNATEAQKTQFKREFTEMVIGIYAAPLAQYDGDKIVFRPLSQKAAAGARVQVQSVIIRKSGQKIPVNYRMVKIGGDWKVYDFSIEGISMVQSYRSQFASVLRQQGFAGLLRKISAHNRTVS